MQKRRLKKITCAVAASLMGLSMPAAGAAGIGNPLIQSVSAADPETHTVKQGTKEGFMYTYSTIDKTKKGSIQIYKYEENNGVMAEGTGFKDDSATKTKDGQARRPISGVQFKGLKIADVVNVPGNDTVGTYYTNLNPIFTDLLKEYGLAQVPKAKVFTGDDADKSGKYYTTSSIEDALKQLNQSPVPSSENGADNEKGGRSASPCSSRRRGFRRSYRRKQKVQPSERAEERGQGHNEKGSQGRQKHQNNRSARYGRLKVKERHRIRFDDWKFGG